VKHIVRIAALAGVDKLVAACFFLIVVQGCSGRAAADTDSSMGGAGGSSGSSAKDSGSDAGATDAPLNPELVNCPAQRSVLLAALKSDSEPCASDDDCDLYLAWSLPHDSRLCDGGWPVAHRDSHTAELDADVQAIADCMAKAEVEDVGTCGRDYGVHSPICQLGRCELDPATF